MGRHPGQRDTDPLSGRSIAALAWDRMRHLWRTQLGGAVVVAVLAFLLAWAASGFSKQAGSQATTTVVFPVAAVILWLVLNGLWHLWRAPVRLARIAADDHADKVEQLRREHSEHLAGLVYRHDLQIEGMKGELAEARETVVALEAQTRRPDHAALLREACKTGKQVLTRLTILSDENRRFETACDWAREVWMMLAEHFPHHSQAFYGPDSEAFSWMFPVSCRAEIETMNGYVERYVEAKLTLLHDLLNQYDVAAANRP